ncbi:MAG TPA: trehalase family glycosidase [Anaerolineales bacterium]|nr:trehalase family glycosidase [Anaerolineales bacterium]
MDISLLTLLRDQIDITYVPFSDRGSRLLVYQHSDKSALYVKLAERLIKVEPGIESYLKRLPFIDDLQFIDEQGNPLDFQTSTSPEMLSFQSSVGDFCLVFQDETTLAFRLPDRKITGMRFRMRPTHWHKTDSGGELRHVRDAVYSVNNGKVITNHVQADKDGHIVEFIVQAEEVCSVTLHIGDDDAPPAIPFSVAHKNAEARWETWFEHAPTVNEERHEKYAYAWWVMANNLVSPSGYVKYEAMMPTKAFYVGAWLWDSALHAIAFRHVEPELARNQIRVMLANQLPDGMLPDAIFDEGVVSEISHPIHARVTKPPIMAWAALKIHETSPSVDFLREIYEPLKRENSWWFEHNDDDNDGIVQYTHPYSSGLDNSPLWDHGLPVESPDINTYLVIQMNSLAKIAELIGRDDEAKEWHRKADELTQRMIEHLWDEEAGIFQALHNEKPIPVLTPFNLYPMWTGQLPKEINARLLAHLQDPSEFWGRYALPTVAYNDPAYSTDKMWRGPVWANINYFFIEALNIIGEHQLAKELREKTLSIIAGQADIHEYYNSQSGEVPGSAAPIFGWSAAVFIELAIQEYLEKSNKNDG